jgi:hypothetical protein
MVAMHSSTRLSVKLDSKLDQEAEGSVIDGNLVTRHKGVWGSGSQYLSSGAIHGQFHAPAALSLGKK